MSALLEVTDLSVGFRGPRGLELAVEHVSFEVKGGSTLGLVGESGSGKTVTALSLPGLSGYMGAEVVGGSVKLDGVELLGRDEASLNRLRGRDIGMIFQQPVRSLDPAFSVGFQIAEVIQRHEEMPRKEAVARALELLEMVGIPDPERRARSYPHQMSGGMCQRVMIAIAVACKPKLLIADEPTTALDVTVQAGILSLLRSLQEATGVGMVFVSHDLGVIAEMADVVAVMYAGEIVESGPIETLFYAPHHPYTEGLLMATPRAGRGEKSRGIPGVMPSAGDFPSGCRFHPRCPYAVTGRCDSGALTLETYGDRKNRCVRSGELNLKVPEVLSGTS